MHDHIKGAIPEISRRLVRWLGPLAGALSMNAALFMLMPLLLQQAPAKQQFEEIVPQVQMVRLKRTEQPARRKAPPPQPKREAVRRPKPATRQAVLKQPVWPMEINSRLPGGPGTVAVPAMQLDVSHLAGMGDLFGMADLDRPLLTLTRMPPIYPPVAKRRGIEGWVSVRFIVNTHGGVEDITIVAAEPPGLFEASVRRCVSGWRFQPGTVDGRPVQVLAETTIRFELD